MFNIGEYVLYRSGEICRIDEKTERCFDGASTKEYCKLIPIDTVNSTYYIPSESMDDKVRKLLTKEEIFDIIDSMPDAKEVWFSDKNERKGQFEAMLKSDNFSGIIGMMKSLHIEKEKRVADGKRLTASDERAFSAAEHMLHREFAFVLGISEKDVESFIRNRLEGHI